MTVVWRFVNYLFAVCLAILNFCTFHWKIALAKSNFIKPLLPMKHDAFSPIGGIPLLLTHIWSVSAVLYFIIYIKLTLIFQSFWYFCILVMSFQSCRVSFYLFSTLLKIIAFFLVASTDHGYLNFMFKIICKSSWKFLKHKFNPF